VAIARVGVSKRQMRPEIVELQLSGTSGRHRRRGQRR
jgi:hypothetical protein